ncbi:MAG: hypothetical protein H0U72_11310 [Nitrosospira sp.]|nr:hypothetical protein [Nitrosospira sp.]
MADANSSTDSTQTPISNKFIEAQDLLGDAIEVAAFLKETATIESAHDELILSTQEAGGFCHVIEVLIKRIERANSLLDEHKEDARHG